MSESSPKLRDSEVIARVGRLAERVSEQAPEPGELQRGRAALLAKVQAAPARMPRWSLALPVLAAALTVIGWFAWPRSVVGYDVSGAAVAESGFVQASTSNAAHIQFEDGSAIELEPQTRLRVSQQRARGASIQLEKGRIEVAVAATEGGADYIFEAGPYRVLVVGTAFDLSWDPERGVAVLSMKEGEVSVLGPRLESGFILRAGQRLELAPEEVRLSDRTDITASYAANAAPNEAVETASLADSRGAQSARQLASVASAPTARTRSWAEHVAAGDYEAVLAEVDGRGESSVLASASVGDLMMLADAARYGARPALAASALRAVRARFAGTKSAATSAFLLGRMAEDGGRASEALSLYEAALAEGSPFSAEALGRSMLIENKRNKPRAQQLADRYLASHPKGAYADVAKAIVGQPAKAN
jgi:hypothetical protein